jgi:hypothetical protein
LNIGSGVFGYLPHASLRNLDPNINIESGACGTARKGIQAPLLGNVLLELRIVEVQQHLTLGAAIVVGNFIAWKSPGFQLPSNAGPSGV